MSKSKKIPLIILAIFLIIYTLGFFFVTPIMLSSTSPIRGVAQSIYYHAYQTPINSLSDGNYIKTSWRSLNKYWCSHDSECEVK